MSRQITLTTGILRSLMFEFEELAAIRAQSLTPAGPDTYYPRIVPIELGQILQELNTDDLFHIFIYPTHAEVWHKKHWMDSNSRRWAVVVASNKSTQLWNERYEEEKQRQSKIETIKQLIIQWSPHYSDKAMAGTLHNLAAALSKAPREVADKIPGLTEILYGK